MRCASASDSQTSPGRFPDCYALGFGGVYGGLGFSGQDEDLVLSIQDLGSINPTWRPMGLSNYL